MTMSICSVASEFSDMFRPPVDRAMRVLDRSFFRKSVPLAAARVLDNKHISRCRANLGHDLLRLDRMASVRPDPEESDLKKGRKSLLLRPDIRPNGIDFSVLLHIIRR